MKTLVNRARAWAELGRAEDALRDAKTAVDVDAKHTGAWRRLAECYEALREWEAAESAWDVWGRLSGSEEEARRRIGRMGGWTRWFGR